MDHMGHMRVLVAGGGVAGLETVLALQSLAGERVAIDLLAPERHFTHRPLSVLEPFHEERPEKAPLAELAADLGVQLHRDAVARVDTNAHTVHTQDGARLDYDALVLALGARAVEAVPGALTFRGSRDAHRLRDIVDALRQGTVRRVAFAVPRGTTWPLPLYELALQTAHAVPGAGVLVVTPEPAPLAAFGPVVAAEVERLLTTRGVEVRTGTAVQEYAGGRLWLDGGQAPEVDRVVALPWLVGPHVRGVPSDPIGFVPVDDFTRALDCDGVYAVGDVAAHGIKQGGLAAQQADIAAQVIAAAAGADVEPAPFRPVLRAKLVCGDDVRYLRHDAEGGSTLSDELLWWPPDKVAGRHLAHFLARRAAVTIA